jgi:hypothetical protein
VDANNLVVKVRRIAAVLAALSLTSCGSKDEPVKSDLTLPITAPMQARERLLHDMKKNKDAAKERERKFDETIDRDR